MQWPRPTRSATPHPGEKIEESSAASRRFAPFLSKEEEALRRLEALSSLVVDCRCWAWD